MANNKVSSLLNVDLPKPKRSNFNLGRVNRFSADVGWLIPCYTEDILPNSYKRLDVEGLIQTNATVSPLMGSFKVKVDAFFIPLRLYYRHLDLNNVRPDFSDNFDYHYMTIPTQGSVSYLNSVDARSNAVFNVPTTALRPYVSLNYWSNFGKTPSDIASYSVNMTVSPASLLEYLGMLPAGYNAQSWYGNKKINANAFIGYYDIYRNYYANPHDPHVPFRYQNSVYEFRDSGNFLLDGDINDVYLDLTLFDKFISYINTASYNVGLDSSSTPVAVDVYRAFKQCFNTHPSSLVDVVTSPPLFAGEAAGLPVEGEGNERKFYPADTRDGIHFGLLRRTYMDDYFNSRFANDFVTYAEEQSRLVVQNNEIYISQLRLQNRVAKYVDKSVFSDTRFGSWLKAHFGVKSNNKLNIPQFLGSITTNVVFNDIYATAQTGKGDITSNQALGSRSSLGQGYLKNKGSFIEFKATEPGILMCLFSIIPYVSYFEGIKKMYLKTSFADMYKPEFDAVGYDDLQKLELFAVGRYTTTYNDNLASIGDYLDINEYNVSVGKHPSWMEYMTAVDESHGLFTQRFQYGYYVLNRSFAPNVYDGETAAISGSTKFATVAPKFDATTYIQPELFNTIFAVDKYTDNFQVQLRFFDKTKQPISKQILPHL